MGPMTMRLQRGMLQKLWYERPVRTQLLIAVGAINLLAALLAGAVSILNTRTATRVEIEASLEVAEHFVAATLKDISARDKNAQLNEDLSLHLKNLRHVRIMFVDTMGELTVLSPQAKQRYVPRWFASLVPAARRPRGPGRCASACEPGHHCRRAGRRDSRGLA